ncbi:TIGR04104 family putative zinc finger protein [uncultured Roseivirga sp.]|uniref:TIGR04104 family putative zinc finger protein n=1 Tax=Roseivirga spongicola TaxID=333140 RepID=UPI000D78DF54|nr:MAG: hypothetical protein DCO95_01310 [Roseivirga sp. XM-24bin3]
MNSRTCPNCNHKYPFKKYLKVLLRLQDTQFECENCKSTLTVNLSRRFVLAPIAFFPILITRTFVSFFSETFQSPSWISYSLFGVILLLWIFSVYQFDSFKLTEKPSY